MQCCPQNSLRRESGTPTDKVYVCLAQDLKHFSNQISRLCLCVDNCLPALLAVGYCGHPPCVVFVSCAITPVLRPYEIGPNAV